jgi:hypothetical protein
MSIFPETKLHTQLKTRLQTLKRELERLSVRKLAVVRCKQAVLLQKTNSVELDTDDEEATDDIIASIEAVDYDLTIFCEQLLDRQKHLAKGIALLAASAVDTFSELLIEHFIEEADLCIRDARVAREGYDELIADLNTLTV